MTEFNEQIMEQGFSTEAGKSIVSPPLEELVSMINKETGQTGSSKNVPSGLAQKLAQEKERFTQQFVRFGLNETVFGINLSNAMEVGQVTSITPLPNLPHWIVGISNVRGEILSIIDLKSFLEWPTTPIKKSNPFIILHNGKMKIGVLVDRIMGTLSIDQDEDLQKVKFDQGKSVSAAYITGVTKSKEDPVYLLDVNKLLGSSQMTNI